MGNICPEVEFTKKSFGISVILLHTFHSSAQIYRPSFRKNKPKTLIFND
jgi:hypothetical protein